MKFEMTNYKNVDSIVNKLQENLPIVMPVTVESDNVTADGDGNKIVAKGTPLGGITKAVLENEDEHVEPKNETPDLTIDNTNADADVLVTAKKEGVIKVALVDPSANDAALGVEISGDTINVNLATDGSGNITSTANNVIDAINNDLLANQLVEAETVEGQDGSGVVEAQTATALSSTNGSSFEAEGLALYEVDVTDEDRQVQMLVLGVVKPSKIDVTVAEAAKEAMQGVYFVE